ncbi:MAG: hypothetical protein VB112_04060 [Oscillospiraceae bacterium]|nr:hypothetical protein [Oscillospiraceae bacterium]
MACFLVPTAEAIVATIVTKSVEKKEKASAELTMGAESAMIETEGKIPFSRKLKWLTNMLWGGSALLAFEHVWHGEVVPWFPFLTAASNPADASVMLHEMATVGVSMAVLVTVIWAGMVAVSNAIEKRTLDASGAQASIG